MISYENYVQYSYLYFNLVTHAHNKYINKDKQHMNNCFTFKALLKASNIWSHCTVCLENLTENKKKNSKIKSEHRLHL